ncbi:cationic amino acid transporter 2 isoform X2 [Leptinotarsa decemlineata]
MLDKKVEKTFAEWMPINVRFLATYPDFLSMGIIIFFTVLLSTGMKSSKNFNNICTSLNLITMLTAVVACLTKVDINNWKISVNDIDETHRKHAGNGGFLPFGMAGVIAATPNCFFGYTGFESSSNASEEAKNPKRDIPIAIMISLLITLMSYFTISTVITLVWPYYLQDEHAAFPHVFEELGWTGVKWVITVGSTCALSTTMFGSMYTMPRVIYAMANDGLIFKSLSKVNSVTKTPLIATICSGAVAGVITTFIDLAQLVDFSTIESLLSYTIVPVSVLVLRYKATDDIKLEVSAEESIIPKSNIIQKLFNLNNQTASTKETSHIANCAILLYVLTAFFFTWILVHGVSVLPEVMYYICLSSTIIGLLLLIIIMLRQPESNATLHFKVPCSPFIPCASVTCNIYLMMQLNLFTWIGFVSWLVIGSLVYFAYGMRHSEENLDK